MTATFVYDGDCGFCTRSAEFAQRRVPTAATIVPWQRADLTALGLTVAEVDEAVQWVAPGQPVRSGPAAIAELLRSSGRRWRWLGGLLARRPVLSLAWPAYRLIARNRHRMPGGTAACVLPSAERGGSTSPAA
ncbi:DUF393 domain-containing protein [Natronosporangium hydrolyticum]|uniref:DUF393 domain-containing protein n=1 Tax=Natronosporangium hydrolyticum TaxID=2811111 RepID=A0A895Y8L1_9ACTN|nr:DUF393 domain-containing protein [Natronosporangium hydrolyticum]QSB14074.1 DUF393 domain-containing protein [Natronosporangium hydrolyticum]